MTTPTTPHDALTATVVLSSRDRPEMLEAALPHVLGALRPGDAALVVDSASRTEEVARVAHSAGVRCIRVEEPGLSRARNAGVARASTEIVAFTDDDCRPDAEWLDRVREHFADPRVAFVTGRVAAATEVGPAASTLDRRELVRYAGAQDPAGIGHGANMAFRRRVLVELDRFDELLGAGAALRSGEDADMLYRCLAHGWGGVYEPRALVTHEQWRAGREMVALRYGYGIGNGAVRAKVARRQPRTGLTMLVRSLWRNGLAPTLRALRERRIRSLAGTLSWTAGMCVGIARGAILRLDGHNFATGGRRVP
jgi:glycosyltransferase involved in cell wall biosynthesis